MQIIKGKIGFNVQLENHGYDCNINPTVADGCCPKSSISTKKSTDMHGKQNAFVTLQPTLSSTNSECSSSPVKEPVRCVAGTPNKIEKHVSAMTETRSPSPRIEKCGVRKSSMEYSKCLFSSQNSIYKGDCCKYYVCCKHDGYENEPFVFQTPKPCRRNFV